jgi:hypothetical protein
MVECLIAMNPKILQKPNAQGNLPLHLVASNSHCYNDSRHNNLLRMVFLMYPNAINVPNGILKTPLHIICSQWDISMDQVLPTIRPTLNINLDAVDKDGNTPLHAALLHMPNVRLIIP